MDMQQTNAMRKRIEIDGAAYHPVQSLTPCTHIIYLRNYGYRGSGIPQASTRSVCIYRRAGGSIA